MERIDVSDSCPSVDDLECPNGGRVVRLPEQCCAACGMTTLHKKCIYHISYMLSNGLQKRILPLWIGSPIGRSGLHVARVVAEELKPE